MMTDGRPQLGEEQGQWLADLYARQFEPMVRRAARKLPPPSHANAEEVVQTVFAEAAAAASRCPAVRIGEGWLTRRLRSRIVDYHRRAGRQQRLLGAVASVEAASIESARWAEEIVVDRSAVDALLAAIPDPDDQLTLAFKLYGYSEAEIATRMSLGPQGRPVRDRMQRIRRQARAAQNAEPGAACSSCDCR
jgi:RNA polymerase sigma factor (sigma-70 family)